MNTLMLHITLKSEGTFGRGDGVAGLLDTETEYDAETGLPFIRGRVLKGLLVEACADLLFGLSRSAAHGTLATLEPAAGFLFGQAGSRETDEGRMFVGAATLPPALCDAVRQDVRAGKLDPLDLLETLTAIRRQTAIGDESGAPSDGSLRSARCVRRGTALVSKLSFTDPPSPDARALLAACAATMHRGGTARNRGRGRLSADLQDEKKEGEEKSILTASLDHLDCIVKTAIKGDGAQ